jgi:crossover junction endodeoxyribonuclease RusA
MNGPIKLIIPGLPAPQGSKTRMPNGALVESSSATGRAKFNDWRTAVAVAAWHAYDEHGCIDWPAVSLEVLFRFQMPKSRPATARQAGSLWKVSTPDLDKLVRALGDGLVRGGLLPDDNRICWITARKVEVHNSWTGASVTINDANRPIEVDL